MRTASFILCLNYKHIHNIFTCGENAFSCRTTRREKVSTACQEPFCIGSRLIYRCLIVGLGASHTLGSGALAKNEENFRFTERSMHGSDIKKRENHDHERKKFMPPAEAVSSIREQAASQPPHIDGKPPKARGSLSRQPRCCSPLPPCAIRHRCMTHSASTTEEPPPALFSQSTQGT